MVPLSWALRGRTTTGDASLSRAAGSLTDITPGKSEGDTVKEGRMHIMYVCTYRWKS